MLLVRPGNGQAVLDTADGVVVEEADPAAEVRIAARVELRGVEWTCSGVYVADGRGRVETARDRSVGGDYVGVDPYGLYWSADAPDRAEPGSDAPMRVTVTATADEHRAEATYERTWTTPDVTVTDVAEHGLAGRLYLPPGDELPGLVVVGGSEGGIPAPSPSALLANHGVAVLALAYWRAPGLPEVLYQIDVELVGRACDWLRGRRGVRDERPTVLGISRGGEYALLAASLMPDRVGSAISVVGSALPWGALGTGDDNDTSWVFRGEPVAKIWEFPDDPDRGLRDEEMVAAAEIPVENVDGRVLLLSAADDLMWPSTLLSEYAVRRAERFGVADRVEHVAYPDAGHACCTPPGWAIQPAIVHTLDGQTIAMGGTLAGNQAARLDSWRRIRDFLGV